MLHASIVSNLHGVRPGAACATTPTTAVAAVAAAPPQVTPGMVLTAMRSVGLPSLRAITQPRTKTLVNFPTNFYTQPRAFAATVTLLGQSVLIRATPVSFTWHYGDGTTTSSTTPGAPYPTLDITHKYTDAHLTVHPSVDVTYTGRFQVAGGPSRAIPGTVTIPGPTVPLRIAEAVPVLSGDYS